MAGERRYPGKRDRRMEGKTAIRIRARKAERTKVAKHAEEPSRKAAIVHIIPVP